MSADRHARTMLPIPDRPAFGLTTYDAKDPDTSYPPIEPLVPPESAPNVLLILLDDVGFGASSTFGGPCRTPTADRLAVGGLRYNRFHTTALCAPTRQALLTGRNHHSVGMGSITETATSAPGNSSLRPNTKSVGWAWAMDAPCQWTKQVASHWGGTRNGTIVHWPNGIEDRGGLRSQFSHVIDVAPTILEAAGLPEPAMVNGVQQSPMEGTSMLYSFKEADQPERHDLQYFEMFGNRGIYHKGWSAVTKHRTPWDMVGRPPALDDDVWELYDGTDYSQARNLVAERPEMLAKLQRLWLIEATKYNVLPIDDRGAERLEPSMAGRPTLIRGDSQLFFHGMGRLSENSVVSIKNKSFSVTAEVVTPDGRVDGVIIAQGGRFGGWSVYTKNGKAKFVYNVLGIHEFTTESDVPIPAGTHQIRVEFAYDGGGLAKGGNVTLYYDGTEVGAGRVGATQPMIFSADETTDIGYESGTTVTSDYTARDSRFTGKINWVQLDLGKDDHDHFIDPEERLRVAMARQ
jgi:hypothetical protein